MRTRGCQVVMRALMLDASPEQQQWHGVRVASTQLLRRHPDGNMLMFRQVNVIDRFRYRTFAQRQQRVASCSLFLLVGFGPFCIIFAYFLSRLFLSSMFSPQALELVQDSKATIFLVLELARGGELFDRIKVRIRVNNSPCIKVGSIPPTAVVPKIRPT